MIRKCEISVNLFQRHTGWVLDGLIRDAATYSDIDLGWNIYADSKSDYLRWSALRTSLNPFQSEISIFGHHDAFLKLSSNKLYANSSKRVWLTHLNHGVQFSSQDLSTLSKADRIYVQNSILKNDIIAKGVPQDNILVTPGAIDKNIFFPVCEKADFDYVLLSGYFKFRKNPDLIAEVISAMPDVNFLIHGKYRWEFPKSLFTQNRNLRWIEFEQDLQPGLIRNAALYLSLSRIEGGPIGILEALASGVPVVATDTGFARDFLNPHNGALLPNIPTVSEVAQSIRYCLETFKGKPRKDYIIGQLTWSEFGSNLFARD